MYKIYYTWPPSNQALSVDFNDLGTALKRSEELRKEGMSFVTMVSDYADMVGKPGAKGAGSEYVPQLKN